MFDDLDLDDDFSDGEEKANHAKGEATDLAFEQESESGEFDANELLDFTDYKNKRQQAADGKSNNNTTKQNSVFSQKPAGLSIKEALNAQTRDELNAEDDDDDDWGASDDWGTSAPQKDVDLSKLDLHTANLNKLSDADLAAHKRAMDKDFNKNQLKPGDAGFVYDKVVDFSKLQADAELEDDSWGEDDGIGEEGQGQDDEAEYYDEEDEDEAANAALAGLKPREGPLPSNENEDDNDYFDDDFDDDFA